IARDPVEDTGEARDPHLDAALLLDLAARGVHRRLPELDEPAGQAPPPLGRRLAAAGEQDAAAREHDGADAHARIVGVLATHSPSLRMRWRSQERLAAVALADQ